MKRTTYIAKITTQRNEKYLSEGRNLLACSANSLLVSCQPRNFPREFTEKCFVFLTNQSARFISCGIGRSYFLGNFQLSILLWFDFKIHFKSRRGDTFLCQAFSVNIRQRCFFSYFKFQSKSARICTRIRLPFKCGIAIYS